MPTRERVQRLIAMAEQGKFLEAIEEFYAENATMQENGLPPRVMVDCSHANSGRDPERQPAIASELAARIASGDRSVSAVMVESNLLGGAQDYQAVPLVHGRSVTDACLSWEKTLPMIARLADAVGARRKSVS